MTAYSTKSKPICKKSRRVAVSCLYLPILTVIFPIVKAYT